MLRWTMAGRITPGFVGWGRGNINLERINPETVGSTLCNFAKAQATIYFACPTLAIPWLLGSAAGSIGGGVPSLHQAGGAPPAGGPRNGTRKTAMSEDFLRKNHDFMMNRAKG
jgi:hypothetical protein